MASNVVAEGKGGSFGGGDRSEPFPFFLPLPFDPRESSPPLMTIDNSLEAEPSTFLAGEPLLAESFPEIPAVRMLFDV